MRRPDPSVICVVIPARDEERLLPGALDALAAASAACSVDVEVVVVANGCRDRTADVARQHGADVVELVQANVGQARSAGFAHVLGRHAGHLSEVWLASTDADSRVPDTWLEAQRTAAASGADVYLGTVTLALPDRLAAQAWVDQYEEQARREPHGHVHGANIGFSALAYELVGGFAALALSEDVDLVGRLERCGATVAWSAESPVVTSARRVGRASGGVASDISRHAGQLPRSPLPEGGAA